MMWEPALIHLSTLPDRDTPVAAPPPPEPVRMTPASQQMNNRVVERLVNAGVDLTQFKAMSQEEQMTLLQQITQAEQQAMIQGFDVAKLGFDQSR